MNSVPPFSGAGAIGFVVSALFLVQVAWYVGVIVLLVKIWNRVKNIQA